MASVVVAGAISASAAGALQSDTGLRPPEPLYWHSTGDSYAAGEELLGWKDDWQIVSDGRVYEPRGGGNFCARSTPLSIGAESLRGVAYGPLAALMLRRIGTDIESETFTACSGATAEQLFNDWRVDAQYSHTCGVFGCRETVEEVTVESQWGQRHKRMRGQPRSDGRVDVLTLSYGGNDMGFGAIIEKCVKLVCDSLRELEPRIDALVGSTKPCHGEPLRVEQAERERDYLCQLKLRPGARGTLVDFYKYIIDTRLTPRGQLYVVGYPSLVAPLSEWDWRTRLWGCNGIVRADADIATGLAAALNTALKTAVREAQPQSGQKGIHFLDLAELYRTGELNGNDYDGDADGKHELCGPGEDWIGGLGGAFSAGPAYHPNLSGVLASASALADLIQQTHPYHHQWDQYLRRLEDLIDRA